MIRFFTMLISFAALMISGTVLAAATGVFIAEFICVLLEAIR